MAYESITLHQEIVINNIISVHYFEYMSNFSFTGEAHDFWEFLCVDKGTVNVVTDAASYSLSRGDIIFHKPNEFHAVEADGVSAPNLVVIAFECSSPAMSFFCNKVLRIGPIEQNLLAMIIREAKTAFSCRLDDPYSQKLTREESPLFAGEQLIQMYLQQVLIQLRRTYDTASPLSLRMQADKYKTADKVFVKIAAYMEKNIHTHITIDQICRDNLISRSLLQRTFQAHANCGPIDYFSNMKIAAAKHLMRHQNMNFTQIADNLGYTSIHYFSRQFKKLTGMTPSEYTSSIKSLSEGAGE